MVKLVIMGEHAKDVFYSRGIPLANDIWKRWRLTAIWAVLMAALCLLPANAAKSLGALAYSVPFLDKLAHAVGFGLLALLGRRALCTSVAARRSPLMSVEVSLGAIGYGMWLEIWQARVPGRICDPWDIVANSAGVLIVILLWHLWVSRKH